VSAIRQVSLRTNGVKALEPVANWRWCRLRLTVALALVDPTGCPQFAGTQDRSVEAGRTSY
jgi:hypothetical protein